MTLSGNGREITEYSIAVNALGRPPAFSPAADSSVRSRARELRLKLQRYYQVEEPQAAVRIELPKGSYTPRFYVPALKSALVAAGRTHTRLRSRTALAAVALLLAVAAVYGGFLLGRRGRPAPADPILREAWGPLSHPDANVLICTATALHMVVRPYMSIVAEGLPKYPAPPELYPFFGSTGRCLRERN